MHVEVLPRINLDLYLNTNGISVLKQCLFVAKEHNEMDGPVCFDC